MSRQVEDMEAFYVRHEGIMKPEDLDRLYRQGWRLISFAIDPHDIYKGFHYYFERKTERKSWWNFPFEVIIAWLIGLGVLGGYMMWIFHIFQ